MDLKTSVICSLIVILAICQCVAPQGVVPIKVGGTASFSTSSCSLTATTTITNNICFNQYTIAQPTDQLLLPRSFDMYYYNETTCTTKGCSPTVYTIYENMSRQLTNKFVVGVPFCNVTISERPNNATYSRIITPQITIVNGLSVSTYSTSSIYGDSIYILYDDYSKKCVYTESEVALLVRTYKYAISIGVAPLTKLNYNIFSLFGVNCSYSAQYQFPVMNNTVVQVQSGTSTSTGSTITIPDGATLPILWMTCSQTDCNKRYLLSQLCPTTISLTCAGVTVPVTCDPTGYITTEWTISPSCANSVSLSCARCVRQNSLNFIQDNTVVTEPTGRVVLSTVGDTTQVVSSSLTCEYCYYYWLAGAFGAVMVLVVIISIILCICMYCINRKNQPQPALRGNQYMPPPKYQNQMQSTYNSNML